MEIAAMFLPLAEEAQPQVGPPGGILPMLVFGFAIFYLLVLRPLRKQDKERQAMLSTLKKGDKIITQSGIYGTVVAVADKDDEMTVKVDDNVRLRMLKSVVLRNLTNEEAAREAKAKPPAAAKSEAVTTKPEGGR